MPDPRPILWAPTPERAAATRMAAYMRWLEQERGLAFADYQALWAWSVADLEGFWTSIIDFFGLQVHDRDVVLGRRAMPGADWEVLGGFDDEEGMRRALRTLRAACDAG